MREILTIIGCLLVTLLTAALVGPWLVDWTAQRRFVEAELSRTLGTPVQTRGRIDLRLLPSPRLVLAGVEAGGTPGQPTFRSGEVLLELSVTPLLRGQLRFVEATVEAPQLRVAAAPDGSIRLPDRATDLPGDVQFDRIALNHGRITIANGSGDVTLDVPDFEGEAGSLAGPFKGSGHFVDSGIPVAFHFATGAREDARMRLKLVLDGAGRLPRTDLDGALVLAEDAGVSTISAFDGNAVLTGTSPVRWRAAGPLRFEAGSARLDPLDLRIGAEDAGVAMTGKAAVAFGDRPRADVVLSAKQVDLDRIATTRAKAQEPPLTLEVMRRWLATANVTQALPFAVTATIETPAVLLGGETLADGKLSLAVTSGEPLKIGGEISGPGRSRLAIEGTLETGAAAQFVGTLETSARDLGRLSDWLAPGFPEAATGLRFIPFRAVAAAGRVVISDAGISASDMTLKLDRSSLAGAAAFTRAIGQDRARLFADLKADALDLDGVPDLTGASRATSDADVSLSLDARAVRLARVGEGMVDSGRIRLRVEKTADKIRIDDLSVTNLGGATLSASGEAGSQAAHLEARVDAQRLGDLAALVRRVAPGPWADAFAMRATALSPARLNVQIAADRARPGADLEIGGLKIDGTLRDTRISGSARPGPTDNSVALDLLLDAPETPLLLRQIGLETVPFAGAGRGHVQVTMRGGAAHGFETGLDAVLSGVNMVWQGHFAGPWSAPDVAGSLHLRSDDAAGLLRVLAFGLPDVTQGLPVDVTANVVAASGDVQLTGLAGQIAGSGLGGRMQLHPGRLAGAGPQIEGSLELQRASIPSLLALVLGPPQSARPGALWSDIGFAPGLPDLPATTLDLRIADLRITDRLGGRNARLRLRLGSGLLAFEDLAAGLDRGQISGDLTVRRDGPTASLAGHLALEGLRLERAGASGTLSGKLAFSSTGPSAAALAGGLAGAGDFRSADVTLSRADPDAPTRVIAQSDSGQLYMSENDFLGALRRELDRAPLRRGEQPLSATMAAGVLRLAAADGSVLSLDLRSLTPELRLVVTASPLPRDWAGSPPQITIIDRDGNRDLDAGAFVNALASRAIAREAARIEAFEADVRERAYFARRKRGTDFMRQRQKEIDDFLAEQQRLAAQAEQQRLEEERRAAEAALLADRDRRTTELRSLLPAPLPTAPVPLPLPAPVNIGPPPLPTPETFRAPPASADPSAAGRY